MKVTIEASLHPKQFEIHNDSARFRVVSAGRRFGKTRLGVMDSLSVAIAGGRAWWVAPSYQIARVGWRPISSIARKIPGAKVSLGDFTVYFPGGGEARVRSADNPDGLRGEGLDFVVLDEAAYIQEEAWSEVLRPALSDKLGKALFISTPRGRNWFWRLWLRGANDEEGWKSWKLPTSENPYIDRAEIEQARRELPETVFLQEYEAEFVDADGAIFRRVNDAVSVAMPQDSVDGAMYVVGVDVASEVDYTVVTVLDVDKKQVVYIDRFNRVDYPVLVERIAATLDKYKPAATVIERNGVGQAVVDYLAHKYPVVGFTTTNASKAQIISSLQIAFERNEIKIPNNLNLISELLSFEGKRTASGTMSYSAPPGMHDDMVMSLALAHWAADRHRGTVADVIV